MKGRIRTVVLNRALAGAFITLLFAFSMSVRAAVPEIMNFQGKLTDSGGTAITSAVAMTFKLYTSASGGAAVWTEVQSVTPDINGLYSVHLGEVTPFNIVFSTAYWLGVTVGSDGEMSPRYRLVSSPYALQASSSSWAEGVNWSGVADKPSLNIFLSTSAFTVQHASLPGVRISSGLIIANGNVGISTGAPQGRLDVLAAGSSATDMVQIWRRGDGVIVGSMSASGNMTAVKFLGDGSGLSGIAASQVSAAGVQSGSLGQNVIASSIAVGAVYTSALAAGAVTDDKIAGVSSSKLSGSVPPALVDLSTVAAALSGISGDSLGTHVATTTLQMGSYGVITSNNITAARYQIAGSTVLAVLPGTASLGVGIDAGRMNTGPYNSFLGYRAGYSNTTGSDNTFLGYLAGGENTTGWDNTFLGRGAGYYNTTGNSNSFIGNNAGLSNTTGSYNSFLGDDAGLWNATGNFNSIVGYRAGYSNTTGSFNSFLGSGAGGLNTSGGNNSFIGYNAGTNNTTGNYNSFLGSNAGRNNDTGNYNSFVGYAAGYHNTTGNYNAFVGYGAGDNNTSGTYNSFVGYGAGTYNTTGRYNSFLGDGAGNYTETGSANAIFGGEAGFGAANNSFSSSTIMGYQAGYGLTTGSDNILLGFRAGYGITTGTGNIVIGYAKDTSAPTANNELNIGGLIYGDLSGRKVGIGTVGPQSSLHVADGKYAQFEDNNAGAPPVADCDSDQERGRLSIDTANNRLYICNGAARGWDYLALTD